MDHLERLVAIEDIRLLKAKYFRFVDLKMWDDFFELFTADGSLLYESVRDTAYTLDEAREMIPAALPAGTVTVHHGFMPEIEIINATCAKAVWAMADRIVRQSPDGNETNVRTMEGFGHYHETYRREDDRWLIETLRLTRLRRAESRSMLACG